MTLERASSAALFQDEEQVKQWAARIDGAARANQERPHALLVFINPWGGCGRAPHVWAKEAAPIFKLAGTCLFTYFYGCFRQYLPIILCHWAQTLHKFFFRTGCSNLHLYQVMHAMKPLPKASGLAYSVAFDSCTMLSSSFVRGGCEDTAVGARGTCARDRGALD